MSWTSQKARKRKNQPPKNENLQRLPRRHSKPRKKRKTRKERKAMGTETMMILRTTCTTRCPRPFIPTMARSHPLATSRTAPNARNNSPLYVTFSFAIMRYPCSVRRNTLWLRTQVLDFFATSARKHLDRTLSRNLLLKRGRPRVISGLS